MLAYSFSIPGKQPLVRSDALIDREFVCIKPGFFKNPGLSFALNLAGYSFAGARGFFYNGGKPALTG